MPLQVINSIFKNIDVSIWYINESEDFLLSKIDLTKNCKERLNSMKSSQLRKQFLSVRNIMKQKKSIKPFKVLFKYISPIFGPNFGNKSRWVGGFVSAAPT